MSIYNNRQQEMNEAIIDATIVVKIAHILFWYRRLNVYLIFYCILELGINFTDHYSIKRFLFPYSVDSLNVK